MTERTGLTCVVHVERDLYDVYIGRGLCPTTGTRGAWGNPWSKREHGERVCLERFLAMIGECVEDPQWRARATRALQGQILGCWCHPELCHGDILARVVDGQAWPTVRAWALEQLEQRERETESGRQLRLFAEAAPGGQASH